MIVGWEEGCVIIYASRIEVEWITVEANKRASSQLFLFRRSHLLVPSFRFSSSHLYTLDSALYD